jgi:predicted nuclease of restriction endonuclease-like RecB superfamily
VRFSLQDVKKSIQRRGSELAVSLHFLHVGELHGEIERLIAYYEDLLGRPQRHFSLDDARAYVGDYRLAYCLIATLSNWYLWKPREWADVWPEAPADLSSPIQLRLTLYAYINEHYRGFLQAHTRVNALYAFAADYHLSTPNLEYLLALDSEEEALLTRASPQAPTVQDVATLYNQWVFEAALFNASSARFVIDCNAFARTQQQPVVGTGVGAAIKRLCYLARKLGVYYDLAYESMGSSIEPSLGEQFAPPFLTLTLYGPQEVTGAPQQYGLRLARLCRLLLNYSAAKSGSGRAKKQASLSGAVVEAEATVHFLQRTYNFNMDANLLQLLPAGPQEHGRSENSASLLFDSSIEQAFSEAFVALANGQGVDGWQLEREPEPLLLDQGIFIPDFALTRGQRRIYVEILGFWTPAYRERKLQKLQYLRGRNDLLLAIPIEAKEAFASIAADFPIVIYNGQLSVTEVLQVLRSRYDDFAERLERVDIGGVRTRVRRDGLLGEQDCYEALHCYRRTEIQRVAERIVDEDIAFVPGIGLYQLTWLAQLKQALLEWLRTVQPIALANALGEIRARRQELQACEDPTIEALLGLWPEVHIRRDSIFDAQLEMVDEAASTENIEGEAPLLAPVKVAKRQVRERRVGPKKRVTAGAETTQGNLWE